MTTFQCTALNCSNIGTRFGSGWMYACKDHADMWSKNSAKTDQCSSFGCWDVGTRFKGSTWMFACKDHTDTWSNEMKRIGVSFINAIGYEKYYDCHHQNCLKPARYINGCVASCFTHATNGSVCVFVNMNGELIKDTIGECDRCGRITNLMNNKKVCYVCEAEIHHESLD